MFGKLFNFAKKKEKDYNEDDVKNLNLFIINKIRSPLADFVLYQTEQGTTLPEELRADPAAWLEILQKMDYAFKNAILDKTKMSDKEKEEHNKQVKEGFELFGRFLQDLYN